MEKRFNYTGWLGVAVLTLFILSVWLVVPAFAQEAQDRVTFHWGQYASEAILAVGAIAAGLVGRAIGLLPGPAQWAIRLTKLDQVAEKAILAAVHDLATTVEAKNYTLEIKNKIVADAAKYVERNAADIYRRFAPTLFDKLKARLQAYIDKKIAAQGG